MQMCNKPKTVYAKEKEKSVWISWILEKDTTNLWNSTKTLNGDETERAKTVLTTKSGFVTGKAAADLLAKTYQSDK